MDIKALFDSAAQDYDRTRRQYIPCFDDFYSTALELIPHNSQAHIKILDIGAGTGLLSGLVAAAFPQASITLSDISSQMLSKAQERFGSNRNIDYLVLDFINAPIVGNYDVVISALALHHTPQDQLKRVFQKIFGALQSGGYFINADQTLGTTPENEEKYAQAWLNGAKAKGCSDRDIEVAIERMKADKTATLQDQLNWLSEVGFVQVDCWYKNYRFAVYSGQRPA
ncbi:class I SAM-dependent methyltransferase [Microcoleus sp. FACHB-672]|uniref:class I SAM-dependent methyltransferase n=1 Tax=Microcoleus sp. FACHB-672 TaxID=2692825 RepID=UPI00168A02B0|nr:class I SAM-dependent methyltransferase [Microcoleus sp. FACHB-672]MBD2040661.1 class I SAM-dependent methyltransferase [Microcoleus sp. FACHB-672]